MTNHAETIRMQVQAHEHEQTAKAALMSPLLDEVYRLRALCALVSANIQREMATGAPLSNRREQGLRVSHEALDQGARGQADIALQNVSSGRLQHMLKFAGAEPTLTRGQFEAELEAKFMAQKS